MAYRGLLLLGGQEIANASRAVTYIESGIAPPTTSITHDDSWVHTARLLGQQGYRVPQLDTAPWYDPLEADSKDFAGVWIMSAEGLDSAGATREVIEGVGDGGVFGKARFSPRRIEVEALLIGRTPPGVDYGLRWLSTALRGDRCANPGMGQTLEYLSSVPYVAEGMADPAFLDCVRPYRRTLYEVACTSYPEITDRFGGIGDDQPGACAYRVKFTLTAGVPYAFRPRALIASGIKWTGAVTPVTWVVQEADPEACTTQAPTSLTDPTISRATIIRPTDTYQLGTVIPLDSRQAVSVIPSSVLKPGQGDTSLAITITAGSKEERYLRVRIGRKPAGTANDAAIACNLISEASISYLPPGGSITLDGVTGRPSAINAAGQTLDASPVVSGTNGAPWKPPILACGSDYVIVADAPGDVSAAASMDVYGSLRET